MGWKRIEELFGSHVGIYPLDAPLHIKEVARSLLNHLHLCFVDVATLSMSALHSTMQDYPFFTIGSVISPLLLSIMWIQGLSGSNSTARAASLLLAFSASNSLVPIPGSPNSTVIPTSSSSKLPDLAFFFKPLNDADYCNYNVLRVFTWGSGHSSIFSNNVNVICGVMFEYDSQ